MPARLRLAPTADVAAALARVRAAEPDLPDSSDLRMLTKHFLAVLESRAPGKSVEVRVPPYAAVQVVPGVRHTRGTPPAVVEMDAATWIALAAGDADWFEVERSGRVAASGERTDLSVYLPLTDPNPQPTGR
ncbi:sterol carrier family protein [Nocardioides salsibiostraticola]